VAVSPTSSERSAATVAPITTDPGRTGDGASCPSSATPNTATFVVPPSPPWSRDWLMPRASARATPAACFQLSTCAAVTSLSVKDAAGWLVPGAPKTMLSTGLDTALGAPPEPVPDAAPSFPMADVDWSPSPAVSPESSTSSSVTRATTPPIRENRPLANRISRIARNTLYFLQSRGWNSF